MAVEVDRPRVQGEDDRLRLLAAARGSNADRRRHRSAGAPSGRRSSSPKGIARGEVPRLEGRYDHLTAAHHQRTVGMPGARRHGDIVCDHTVAEMRAGAHRDAIPDDGVGHARVGCDHAITPAIDEPLLALRERQGRLQVVARRADVEEFLRGVEDAEGCRAVRRSAPGRFRAPSPISRRARPRRTPMHSPPGRR